MKNIFSRNQPRALELRGGAAPGGELIKSFAPRVQELSERAESATTLEDSLTVARDSAALVTDLFKSFGGSAPANEDLEDEDPNDAGGESTEGDGDGDDTEGAGDNDGAGDGDGDNEDAQPAAAPGPKGKPGAPAANPAALVAASGPGAAALKKSISELLSEASADAAGLGAEALIDGTAIIVPLLKSLEAAQEQGEVTNTYLEHVGLLLTKSLEGSQRIFDNQQLLHTRIDALEANLSQQSAAHIEEVQTLQKSFAGVATFIGNYQTAPSGTPTGRAPLQGNAVAGFALGDVTPSLAPAEESHLGFTRGDLKKSIEAHIRSGEAGDTGITTAHYQEACKTPLDQISPLVYEVAAKALNRPLPK